MKNENHICIKCAEEISRKQMIYQAQTGRRGIVCADCRQAEIDCLHYEQTGQLPNRRQTRKNSKA